MSVIPESGMNFGKYDEKDLFHIETSEIYKKLGDGIPTVEFILKYNENNIVFGAGRDAVFLDAAHIGGGHPAREDVQMWRIDINRKKKNRNSKNIMVQ